MEEWTDGRKDGWMGGMEGRKDGQMKGLDGRDGQGRMDGKEEWTDRWIGRPMDGWMD